MKTYGEIQSKYADALKTHRGHIGLASSRVIRLRGMIEALTEEREQYRQGKAAITAENAGKWNELTRSINALQARLRNAEKAEDEARIGAAGMERLDSEINKMAKL